jgi:DNA processing protein
MSHATTTGVCRACARRAWLLGRLAAALERTTGADPARVWSALALGDEELIEALGGERREALRAEWRRWSAQRVEGMGRRRAMASAVCRHHCAYPSRLAADPLAPTALRIEGDAQPLCGLQEGPVVALVGTSTPSEYGMRCARTLAGELACAEVTIVCAHGALGACARQAALARGGKAIVLRTDAREHTRDGSGEHRRAAPAPGECRVAELLAFDPPPGWRRLSDQRILALLADLIVVIEASDADAIDEDGEERWELACVELARWRGTRLAAVPGCIDSPLSAGTNVLILERATPALSARQLLDELKGVGELRRMPRRAGRARRAHRPHQANARAVTRAGGARPSARAGQRFAPSRPARPVPALDQRLSAVLARVGAGEDTLAALCAGEPACEEPALALTELELLGLLRRAPDGRYEAGSEHLG